jgi:hypothetical protein
VLFAQESRAQVRSRNGRDDDGAIRRDSVLKLITPEENRPLEKLRKNRCLKPCPFPSH